MTESLALIAWIIASAMLCWFVKKPIVAFFGLLVITYVHLIYVMVSCPKLDFTLFGIVQAVSNTLVLLLVLYLPIRWIRNRKKPLSKCVAQPPESPASTAAGGK